MPQRQNSEHEVTMFPFLSVLCAVIGVLMLFVLVIMSSRAIEAQNSLHGEVTGQAVRDQEVQAFVLTEQRCRELNDQVRQLEERLDRRRQKQRELSKLYTQLVEIVAAKEDAVELASSPAGGRRTGTRLGAPQPIAMVPDPNRRVVKTPILLEVEAQDVVVQPQKTACPLRQLEQTHSPLAEFLDGVNQKRDREYLLLLVRPNGVAAYRQLRTYLHQRYGQTPGTEVVGRRTDSLDIGKEPFSEDWLLSQREDNAAPRAAEP